MLTQQAQTEVREMIQLLMQRPISETVAMCIEEAEGFHHLEISGGEWHGFDEDEYMGGKEHGRIEFKLILCLGNHVEAHKLGVLYTGDTDFVLDGDANDIRIKRRPDTQEIVIHYPDHTSRTFSAEDTLNGGELLPNFTLTVGTLFTV